MEIPITCKGVKANYKQEKMALGGPIKFSFILNENNNDYTISINQYIVRMIKIESSKEISTTDLYNVLLTLEKLLMLFEGHFININSLKFYDSNNDNDSSLVKVSEKFLVQRLHTFKSMDLCFLYNSQLVEYNISLSSKLFFDFEQLMNEIYTIHQTYLSAIQESWQYVDIRCAFLIELAESLVDLLKDRLNIFPELQPGKTGKNGTSLKMCLKSIIVTYGKDIFSKEMENDFEEILSCMVNTRVNVLHIRKNRKEPFLNGEECALYICKLSLLYRKILLIILGFSEEELSIKSKSYIHSLNKWNDILYKFLLKL